MIPMFTATSFRRARINIEYIQYSIYFNIVLSYALYRLKLYFKVPSNFDDVSKKGIGPLRRPCPEGGSVEFCSKCGAGKFPKAGTFSRLEYSFSVVGGAAERLGPSLNVESWKAAPAIPEGGATAEQRLSKYNYGKAVPPTNTIPYI